MRLDGRNGQSLELILVGYQFPHLAHQAEDSNWLNVRISVVHPRGTWSATDPCLMTTEVCRLADWLEAVGHRQPHDEDEGFLEPCISFRVTDQGEKPILQVFFELEMRPTWAPSRAAGQEDLWVEWPIDELDLVRAAYELRQQLLAHPAR